MTEFHCTFLAVAGHHDCAGNPAPKEAQVRHIKDATKFIQARHPHLPVIGLWVDEKWKARETE